MFSVAPVQKVGRGGLSKGLEPADRFPVNSAYPVPSAESFEDSIDPKRDVGRTEPLLFVILDIKLEEFRCRICAKVSLLLSE